jgi:hypothetical protein
VETNRLPEIERVIVAPLQIDSPGFAVVVRQHGRKKLDRREPDLGFRRLAFVSAIRDGKGVIAHALQRHDADTDGFANAHIDSPDSSNALKTAFQKSPRIRRPSRDSAGFSASGNLHLADLTSPSNST